MNPYAPASPAADQRDSITRTLMGIQNPYPQTQVPQLPPSMPAAMPPASGPMQPAVPPGASMQPGLQPPAGAPAPPPMAGAPQLGSAPPIDQSQGMFPQG